MEQRKRITTILKARKVNSLVEYGLGDWVGPGGQQINNPEAATVVRAASQMIMIANLAGKNSDAEIYTSDFANNVQSYNSIPGLAKLLMFATVME
jgi:hypothetical protein